MLLVVSCVPQVAWYYLWRGTFLVDLLALLPLLVELGYLTQAGRATS